MSESRKISIATLPELFVAFGGPKGIAHAISRGNSTASEMKRRGSIPVEHWPAILTSDKGRELGLTAEDLMRLHVPGSSSGPPSDRFGTTSPPVVIPTASGGASRAA